MLLVVIQAVDERISNLARAREIPPMVSIRPDAPAATAQLGIHATIRANCEALHATSERLLVLRLHDEVYVVFLHGVLDDAEVVATRLAERVFECRIKCLKPEVRQTGHRPHRDVERVVLAVSGTRSMAHLRIRRRLPTGRLARRSRPRRPIGKRQLQESSTAYPHDDDLSHYTIFGNRIAKTEPPPIQVVPRGATRSQT